MNPYRIEPEKQGPAHESLVREDDIAIVWIWLCVGVILILTDVGQPGPWDAWSSLGMLVSGLAVIALWRHYVAKWGVYRAAQKAARNQREV